MRKDELVQAIGMRQVNTEAKAKAKAKAKSIRQESAPILNQRSHLARCENTLVRHNIYSVADFLKFMVTAFDPEIKSSLRDAKMLAGCIEALNIE
jgi:hypothetical protein